MGITLCLLLVSLLSPTACGLEGARCTRTRPTLLQSLRGGSPSLRTIRLEGAKRLRILVLREPTAQAGKISGVHGGSREWVVNQDAYDLVDFVNAAFVDDSHVGIASPAAHSHDHDQRPLKSDDFQLLRGRYVSGKAAIRLPSTNASDTRWRR